jgi:1-acyl-sn-glycerol-3-phosphate acyltransferase
MSATGVKPAGAQDAGTADRDGAKQRRGAIPLGRRLLNPILRFLIRLFLDLRVKDEPRVPNMGAGIVYYNHIHWLDPVLITGRLHRYGVPLTKIEASRWPVLGWVLKIYHVIFITRGVVDRAALKANWQVLAEGDLSIISPEGTRSHDGRMQTAKEGLAFVAQKAPDCWLIPAAVTGTPTFRFKLPLINRPLATITYGRPFRFRWPRAADGSIALPEGRASRDVLREMTDQAMGELAARLPEEMRGAYADEVGTNRSWLEFID